MVKHTSKIKTIISFILAGGLWYLLTYNGLQSTWGPQKIHTKVAYFFILLWIVILLINRRNKFLLIVSEILSVYGIVSIVLYWFENAKWLNITTRTVVIRSLVRPWRAVFCGLPKEFELPALNGTGLGYGLLSGLYVCVALSVLALFFILKVFLEEYIQNKKAVVQ